MISNLNQTLQPRIGVVATRALATLVRSMVSDYTGRLEVRMLEMAAQDAILPLQDMIAAGLLDAVIAAGQGAQLLRDTLPLPVATIGVNGYDILHALAAAKRIQPRAVLLSRRRLADEFDELRPLLNVDVTQLVYDTDESARRHLETLSRAMRPVVVGSSQIIHFANEFDLPGVLVYSRESIARAFESAVELTRIARMEAARRERLDRMLESLSEGVVAVDMHEQIQSINPALARLIGVTPERAMGKALTLLAPTLSLTDVLRDGEGRRDEVTVVNGRALVTQRLPLIESGVQVGAVLTLQESSAIERADRKLRAQAKRSQFQARYRLEEVLGTSPPMQAAREMAQLYATSESSVLILGESGTGKELFAQGIHLASRRASGPFVAINCAAFPENLLESELFGYEEGAFTGSRRGGKPGLVELAHRGTLFLDEVGDMPLPMQTRLLRVLQEREVLRLGSAEPLPVDVRVIAATHADLTARIAGLQFRGDLYYRLAILTLSLPSLVKRGGDLPLIATALAKDALTRLGSRANPALLVQPMLEAAQAYTWPGNVRELQNMVERLAVFLGAMGMLSVDTVHQVAPELMANPHVPRLAPAEQDALGGMATAPLESPLSDLTEQTRRDHARAALNACGGDRIAAAQRLGVSRTTLWRLLRDEG